MIRCKLTKRIRLRDGIYITTFTLRIFLLVKCLQKLELFQMLICPWDDTKKFRYCLQVFIPAEAEVMY